MSDKALIRQIGEFVRFHRLQQDKIQEEVAHEAAISRSTLSMLERGEPVNLSTVIQVWRVLDLLHLMENFKTDLPESPIALAKKEKERRRRAKGAEKKNFTHSDW